MEFHIGDRVVLIGMTAGGLDNVMPSGSEGTILDIDGDIGLIRVQWDNAFDGGHTLGGRCPSGYGWNVFKSEIDFAAPIPESDSIDICGLL